MRAQDAPNLCPNQAPNQEATGLPGPGQHVPGTIRYALLTALVPERPMKVREKGCALRIGHGREEHDAQAHAHSASTSRETHHPHD